MNIRNISECLFPHDQLAKKAGRIYCRIPFYGY